MYIFQKSFVGCPWPFKINQGIIKIHFFEEGPKKLTKSSPSILRLLNTVKLTVKILSIFVAFLQNMNFTHLLHKSDQNLNSNNYIRVLSLHGRSLKTNFIWKTTFCTKSQSKAAVVERHKNVGIRQKKTSRIHSFCK